MPRQSQDGRTHGPTHEQTSCRHCISSVNWLQAGSTTVGMHAQILSSTKHIDKIQGVLTVYSIRPLLDTADPCTQCIKDFLNLQDDSGQSGLTLQLFPMVILANQVWRYNCFHWKQLLRQIWLVRITRSTNEKVLYNWSMQNWFDADERSHTEYSMIFMMLHSSV